MLSVKKVSIWVIITATEKGITMATDFPEELWVVRVPRTKSSAKKEIVDLSSPPTL